MTLKFTILFDSRSDRACSFHVLIFFHFFSGKVDEKATQLHAIASLKVSQDFLNCIWLSCSVLNLV